MRLKQPEPAGEIDEVPHFIQLGAIDGRHVDGALNDALGEKIDEQIRGLDGDRFLRLDGRSAEVRRQDDVWGPQ